VLQLQSVQIKNFRCFSQFTVELGHPIVLIGGDNGAGKTSLLEALHYACYLRSFRTHTPRDLVHFGEQDFFVKATFSYQNSTALLDNDYQTQNNEVQVGFAGKKRLVKLNQRAICSYKELLDHYRIITLTENDLGLICGGPEERRSFIDQALMLYDPDFLQCLRAYRQILERRTALFVRGGRPSIDHYRVWTEQLLTYSLTIQEARVEALSNLQNHVNNILSEYFANSIKIQIEYSPKRNLSQGAFEKFMRNNTDLFEQEVRYGRTLFGAHLDDFSIKFQGVHSKQFASRGQQKLVLLLLKIAQIMELRSKRGSAVFLLDDFMTDFDETRSALLLQILGALKTQLIFTSPLQSGAFDKQLQDSGAAKVFLTI